jgi:hypothetical protein
MLIAPTEPVNSLANKDPRPVRAAVVRLTDRGCSPLPPGVAAGHRRDVQLPALTSAPLWLSEHYWPDLVDGLVLTQAQRTALVGYPVHWLATIVVPGQQTAFGLFTGPTSHDVERALLAAGPGADRVSAALRVTADHQIQ